MAFGSKSQELGAKQKAAETASGETKVFVSPFMPTGSGTRLFRILPEIENGEVALTPRLSPNGKPLREGNKKDGAILIAPEPESEVSFLAAWWQVMVDGVKKPRRLIFDIDRRWNNPLWNYIDKHWPQPKGTKNDAKERQVFKTLFAINVYDMSLVKRTETGLWYESQARVFNLQAGSANGKLIEDKDKVPPVTLEAEPLNAVRILEGSYGKPGGKHLFQQLADQAIDNEDSDGLIRRLPEFDLKLRVTGVEKDTRRTITATSNFKPLDPSVALMPRYDLTTWLTPWPDEMIERLLADEDFNELVEQYGISLFPSIKKDDEEELFD